MRIVEPVIARPWLAEWEAAKARIAESLAKAESARAAAARTRRRAEAEALGLQRGFPAVGPANAKGIELNAYAAELARVSVWIGEIQWMRRNGFTEGRDPILKPLETIECRDAILAPDGGEPEWPDADVVIGNPPFLGGKLLRGGLGDDYAEGLRRVYGARLHGEADLVCHWFDKAGRSVAGGRLARVGLVATNSIRGGRNRSVLDRIVENGAIFDAWSDEPWVVGGANVRVSLVSFAGVGSRVLAHGAMSAGTRRAGARPDPRPHIGPAGPAPSRRPPNGTGASRPLVMAPLRSAVGRSKIRESRNGAARRQGIPPRRRPCDERATETTP